MDITKIPYNNHRKIWRSEKFLREYFNVKQEDNYLKNQRVQNFLYKLNQVDAKQVYTFVGYGSIMNESDVQRTLPSYSDHRLGVINGWKKVFNVGTSTAYLNVERDGRYNMNVALMEFPFYELPRLIDREFIYDFVEVKATTGEDALMVTGEKEWVDNTLDPQLNYLHLCMSGAKDLGGLSAINNFLDQTFCYSHQHCNQVTVREYLKELNVVNYMIKNEYSSR